MKLLIIFMLSMIGQCVSKKYFHSFKPFEPAFVFVPVNNSVVIGKYKFRVFHQGDYTEDRLPTCQPYEVCNVFGLYGIPWIERRCTCGSEKKPCPSLPWNYDGRTIPDVVRMLALCDPVKELPQCASWRDTAWTVMEAPNGTLTHLVNCRCAKKDTIVYWNDMQVDDERPNAHVNYTFACSPKKEIPCNSTQPCRLFSVIKKKGTNAYDEVTIHDLCDCPEKTSCPNHHEDPGVNGYEKHVMLTVPKTVYSDFSAYCVSPNIEVDWIY